MVGPLMFLGGFFTALLAFYGRNAPLLMLAIVLLAFCWVGHERVHKAFRLIPFSLCLITCIRLLPQISIYNLTHYYDFTVLLSVMVAIFLLVSMIPTEINKNLGGKDPAEVFLLYGLHYLRDILSFELHLQARDSCSRFSTSSTCTKAEQLLST